MAKQTKYIKGENLFAIDTLAMVLENHEYVYLNDKPLHWAWLYNMSLQRLMMFVRGCHLQKTIERANAVVCAYGDCSGYDCPHRKVHAAAACSYGTHYCEVVFGPVRCIPLAEWEARHA